MIRLPHALAAMSALPLIACAQTAPVEEMPQPQPGAGQQCDASMLGGLVGQTATEALAQGAMKQSGSRTLRVIKPGMAVTMDYRQDRLNIDVDAQNRVTGSRCG